MAKVRIIKSDGSPAVIADKLCIGDTLKTLVDRCDVHFNNELVCSESNLAPYFSICAQKDQDKFGDHHLNYTKYDQTSAVVAISTDSTNSLADIAYERTLRSQ